MKKDNNISLSAQKGDNKLPSYAELRKIIDSNPIFQEYERVFIKTIEEHHHIISMMCKKAGVKGEFTIKRKDEKGKTSM